MVNRKNLSIYNLIAFLATIIINALANIIPINGFNTGELSDLYPNLFVPTGLTFLIWVLIYTLLSFYILYQLILSFKGNLSEANFVDRISYWFLVSSVGNITWILAWHYRLVLLSLIIMIIILISLIMIYKRLKIGKNESTKKEKYLVHIAFSVYLGWISIATIANVTTFLVDINWGGLGIAPQWWTVIVISIGIFLALIYIFKNQDIFYALVVDWALLGIYLKRTAQDTEAVRSVITIAMIGMLLITSITIYRILKRKIYTID